jgi:hypothetical protein
MQALVSPLYPIKFQKNYVEIIRGWREERIHSPYFAMSSVKFPFKNDVEFIGEKFYQKFEEILPCLLMNSNFLKEKQHYPLCWLGKFQCLLFFQTPFGTE